MKRWVDCYIDKFLKVSPWVNESVALIGRWDFKPSLCNGELVYDESGIRNSENNFLEFYGIERTFRNELSFENDDKPVVIPCDLFFLPYADMYYHKDNMFHYLMVFPLRENDGYVVYDDNPVYSGIVSETDILKGYDYVGEEEKCECFNDSNRIIRTIPEEIDYINKYLNEENLQHKVFFSDLIESSLGSYKKLEILSRMTIASKRFYSLERITNNLLEVCNDEKLVDIRSSFTKYGDEWTMICNLATRGLSKDADVVWERIESRIKKLIELEGKLGNLIVQMKELITSRLC